MRKYISFFVVVSSIFAAFLVADDTIKVIKVSGRFAIINKGANQGLKEGQIYFVKREDRNGLSDVCKVKVFRTTANRAAVQQVKNTKSPLLQKGDGLYSTREMNSVTLQKSQQLRKKPRTVRVAKKTSPPALKPTFQANSFQKSKTEIEPISQTSVEKIQVESSSGRHRGIRFRTYSQNIKKPWLGLQAGLIIPNGDFGAVYSPSLKFGASYMAEAGSGFNLGLELNNTFVSSSLGSGNVVGAANTSSSLLEVQVALQKFFGRMFFIEVGGGIYRPKISTTSADNFVSTYSSTNFGVFGGGGFFVPTSEYAGIMLKGRVNNYFDQTKMQYFGITGGFRFKVH